MRLRLATILAITAACTSTDRGDATAGDTGGTLVIALPAEPGTLMPPLLRMTQEKQVADQVFDVLAEIAPDLNTLGDAGWKPRLARSWQWSADSLSIAFSLDPRARWHDGRPVTSRDVQFSVALYKDPKVGSRLADAFADIDSIATPDSLTAVAWYARRSPEQFYNLSYNLLVMPEHLLRDADRANLAGHPVARAPVGSGPFRFVRWEARAVIEIAADTAHYLGRPLLDRVIWTLNTDLPGALAKVLVGEADLLETLTPDGMAQVAAQEQVRAVPYTSLNYGYLGFNLRDPADPARPHPLFNDVGVRRAIAMAIDRRALLKNVYDTLAFLGSGPFSRMLATADTALAMPAFDAGGAGRLLDSLGWRDGDGDGVREKGGRPLRFGLMYPATSGPRRRYAELIQAQLRPIGVRVDVDGADITVIAERMFSGKFDALVNNWASDPSPIALRGSWHSATPANRASNLQLYGSVAADAAMDSAASAADPAASRRLYRAAYQHIVSDVPAVWLYENRAFLALNRRVQHVGGPDNWWRNLRFWSIPAAGRLPRDR